LPSINVQLNSYSFNSDLSFFRFKLASNVNDRDEWDVSLPRLRRNYHSILITSTSTITSPSIQNINNFNDCNEQDIVSPLISRKYYRSISIVLTSITTSTSTQYNNNNLYVNNLNERDVISPPRIKRYHNPSILSTLIISNNDNSSVSFFLFLYLIIIYTVIDNFSNNFNIKIWFFSYK